MSSLEQKENFPAFRSQLLESLKAGGTLDTLKTQVRGHLLQEIRRQGLLRVPTEVLRQRRSTRLFA